MRYASLVIFMPFEYVTLYTSVFAILVTDGTFSLILHNIYITPTELSHLFDHGLEKLSINRRKSLAISTFLALSATIITLSVISQAIFPESRNTNIIRVLYVWFFTFLPYFYDG